MTNKEALKRALKELIQARINLDHGQKNGVPPDQLEALQEKVAYRETVVEVLRPATIDREAWEPCEVCSEQDDPCYKDGCFKENAPKCEYRCDKYLAWRRNLRRIRLAKFCPKCGRPLTEEAWAMLEKRLRGE